MKKIVFLVLLSVSWQLSGGQGCVAVRSNGATCTMAGSHQEHKGETALWTLGFNTRYFKSYKHYVGKEEQKHRVASGTQVLNYTTATELALTHQRNARWSFALYLPVAHNVRSSLYEHYGNGSKSPNARRSTRSFGLGDVRIAAYYWLVNPASMPQGNVQVGAGIKLPTGDYLYQDYFWRNDTLKVLGPVDQSIQLGDGGTGLTTEYNAFYQLGQQWSLYSNGYYLLNPREQNSVSTARGGNPSAAAIAYGSEVMSVPDQFMFRVGTGYSFQRFQFTAGVRIEGVPARDLMGGSNGFRRPGYVVSLEPVALYKGRKAQWYLSVPYAVERNRIQSVPDKIRTRLTGMPFTGDAAFADYTINMGMLLPLRK